MKPWERRRYVWKAAGIYEKMLKYAKERDMTLGGYAYEMGMNEFMIADPEEYLTKIMIRVKEKKGRNMR